MSTLLTRARRAPVATALLGLALLWAVGFVLFRGTGTLPLPTGASTDLHRTLGDLHSWVGANRDTNPVLVALDGVRAVVDAITSALLAVLAGGTGATYPLLGWLGVVALAGWVTAVFGRPRVAVLVVACLAGCGLLGLFTETMQTLALTLAAVGVSLVVGLPLGLWAGLSPRVGRVVTPLLDLAQILPSFVYLAPLALVFLIGPAAGVITTVVYALPPLIRLTMHGAAEIPAGIDEAAASLGITARQRLRWVVLPLARRSIVLGLNQTTLAALAMATIAALVAAPGLGQSVVLALQSQDVGSAAVAGLAVVALAIALDRATSAIGLRETVVALPGPWWRRPRVLVAGGALAGVLVCVQLSRTQLWAALFPAGAGLGDRLADAVGAASDWLTGTLGPVTLGLRDGFTELVLNPLESLLVESPVALVTAVVAGLAAVAAYRATARPGPTLLAALATVAAAGVVAWLGVWTASMITLAATLVAGVVTIAVAVVVGVWLGRSDRADVLVRPILDAAQTIPSFVYLIPFLGLFGPSRFTAIVAAVVYAVPVAAKIVAAGIRAVPVQTMEATRSLGASRWQQIATTQLPMARRSLALAANQGFVYVLSMVVVGGLVGAGGLGYLVVAGFNQLSLFGKGLAAGLTIVVWGVVVDRISQAFAASSALDQGPAPRRAPVADPPTPAPSPVG